MAFADKYHCSFKDRYDRTVSIKFQYDGFAGSSTEVDCIGAEVEYMGTRGNPFDPITGSFSSITLREQSTGQFDEFLSINQKECRVYISYTNFAWYGFVLAGDYQRSYQYRSIVTVKAVDGLGLLRGVPYKNGTAYYTGRDTAFNIIKKCCDKTGLSLGYYDRMNIYEDSMSSGQSNSRLKALYIDQDAFINYETMEVDSCHDVLEKVLTTLSSRIHQFLEDFWVIVRVPEVGDSAYVRIYNNAGTYQSSGDLDFTKALTANSASDTNYLRFTGVNAIYKGNEVRSKINVTRNYISNVVLDSHFNYALNVTDFWTDPSGNATLETFDGVRCLKIPHGSNNLYYTTQYTPTASTGKIRVRMRFRVDVTAGTAPYWTWGCYLKLSGGTSYYTNSSKTTWTTSTSLFDRAITTGEWNEWEFITSTIPAVTQPMYIYIDGGVTNATAGSIYYDYIKVDFLPDEWDGELSKSADYAIKEDNLYAGDTSLEYHLLDSDFTGDNKIWKSTISLASNAVADTWTNTGLPSQNLWRHSRDAHRAFYYSPAKVLQGSLLGQYRYGYTIGDGTRKYYPTAMRTDLSTCTHEGEWVEVVGQVLGDELVTDFSEDGLYIWDAFADNGDGTVTVEFDNTGGSGIEEMRIYLNAISNPDPDVLYKVSFPTITDNGSTTYTSTAFIWGGQSETETTLDTSDVFWFDSEPSSVTPYLKFFIDTTDFVELTLEISVKEYIGN